MQKTLRLAALAAMFIASTAALATHPAPPPPAPSPPGPPVSTSTSGSTSGAGAAAGSIAGSKSSSDANAGADSASTANAKGGDASAKTGDSTSLSGSAAKQGQKQGQTSTVTDASNSSSRTGFYVFPQLAFTPPLPMLECPMARTKQSSTGVLFGAFSHAESGSDGDRCFSVTLYNDFIANCQYESARRFKVEMAKDVYPKFAPAGDSYRTADREALDLTATECALLKLPVLPPAPIETVNPAAVVAAPAASAASAPVPGKKAAKKPQCKRTLQSVWQCERKPDAATATTKAK